MHVVVVLQVPHRFGCKQSHMEATAICDWQVTPVPQQPAPASALLPVPAVRGHINESTDLASAHNVSSKARIEWLSSLMNVASPITGGINSRIVNYAAK